MQSAGTGQLEIDGGSDSIAVSSRTYTRGPSGTFGQSIPSADPADALAAGDAPISIPGLENTPAFRSNIGFAEVGGAGGEVRVRFYDASGKVIDEEAYGIAPFGHLQTSVRAAGEALRAEVSVDGLARVLAYGSVVDNLSGDGIFIPAARVRGGVVPVIHAAGANGTLWRTDIWISNPNGGAVVIRDAGQSVGEGFVAPDPTGLLLVTSRTYTSSAAGSFGQFIPPGIPSVEPATLLGIENDAAFRTNIGVIAPSPAAVRFIAYDVSGAEVWRSDMFVSGRMQFPLPVRLAMGQVAVQVIAGGGVVPYASVVDNGSGDPVYINAIR